MRWNETSNLPMNRESINKVVVLYEGKRGNNLFVGTQYWHTFSSDEDLSSVFPSARVVKNDDGSFTYGMFIDSKIPFEKMKGWMDTNDLIRLYDGK